MVVPNVTTLHLKDPMMQCGTGWQELTGPKKLLTYWEVLLLYFMGTPVILSNDSLLGAIFEDVTSGSSFRTCVIPVQARSHIEPNRASPPLEALEFTLCNLVLRIDLRAFPSIATEQSGDISSQIDDFFVKKAWNPWSLVGSYPSFRLGFRSNLSWHK